mgnify:CR=1 FL=1
MDIIFLKQLIKDKGVSQKELAEALFPCNKFPENALRRVFRGKTTLTADQAKTIADFLGVAVDALYACNGWRGKATGNRHTFTKDEYVAELDLSSGMTRITYKGTELCETLFHCPAVTLSEFLNTVDNIINEQKRTRE